MREAQATEGDRRLHVLSFPKSGRTWLRVMLDEVGVAAKYDHLGWGHQSAKAPQELTIALRPDCHTLALFRDPRDTAVSGYYQASARLKKYAGSMSDFIRDERHGIEKIVRFNLGLADLCAGRADCMMVTYEALLADPAGALMSVAAFAGYPLDLPRAAAIADNNAFDKMQARERSGFYRERYGSALAVRSDAAPSRLKVRRGVAGGYVDELSEADIAYANEVLARGGYFERMRQACRSADPA